MNIPIPDSFSEKGRAQIGAYKKGWIAASEGKPCKHPYQEKRTKYHNGVTFSRSFIISWEAGWKAYHSQH